MGYDVLEYVGLAHVVPASQYPQNPLNWQWGLSFYL